MSLDYCQEISSIINAYRQHDRERDFSFPEIDKAHVERWINQFPDIHEIILAETMNLLQNYYFSEQEIENFLKIIFSSKKIWGENIKESLVNTSFLDCQDKGNSQNRLVQKSKQIISELHNISIGTAEYDKMHYAYIDDGMFSGSTLLKDLRVLIKEIPSHSTIHVIFIIVHSFSEWWVRKNLEEILAAKGVELIIWRIATIQNSGGRNLTFECLWPQEYKSPQMEQYLLRLDREHEEAPEKKIRLFRESNYKGGKYTSEVNRVALEKELMEAGLKIIGFSENSANYMRPMGYDNRISLGFGAFFATYMNMSNNCPLAYWWGDPNAGRWHPFSKWYPLLPRKANSNG